MPLLHPPLHLGDFPFLAVKALEFGLFKTYSILSISKILYSTRELVDRCGRRYDDTDLLIREFLERDPDSPRAEAALERMNAIHAHYNISNPDYLYVLCVFIVEPIRWVERFGFRSPHEKEKVAMHLRWKIIGEQMGIERIPQSYEEAAKYLDKYEEEYMVYADTNAQVANSTMELFLSIVPSFMHPVCEPAVHALCPPRLRRAMGYPDPPQLLVAFLEAVLVVAGGFVKYFLPPRWKPKRRTPVHPIAMSKHTVLYPTFHPFEQTYADGYKISELGPESLCPMNSR
ncbi:hypothetical protein ACHAXT_007604 [Thalassiosira profunda]